MKSLMFNDQMMRANLAGKKTVTRRNKCNLNVGDVVYVKEAYQIDYDNFINGFNYINYKADIPIEILNKDAKSWKSPLYMSEKHSRIKLQIISVSRENLQDITDDDAIKEGVASKAKYIDLWNSINKKKAGKSWGDNPVIYRIEYKIMG